MRALIPSLIRSLTKKGLSPDDIADVIAEIGELDFELPPQPKLIAKRVPRDVHPDFERWYSLYPRHKAKGAAERAFATAMTRTTLDILLAATQRLVRECAGKEAQFIPHGATWLNAKGWLDEDSAPAPTGAPVVDLLARIEEQRAAFNRNHPELFSEAP